MACNGCDDNKTTNKKYDKTGNVMNHPAEQLENERSQGPKHTHESSMDQAQNMKYSEYKQLRKTFRESARNQRDEIVKQFTEDYKRIQIDELISVYNLEEVHFKLTPDQALVALWEFAHDAIYQKVIDEFEGLREQVDIKYDQIIKNKLELKWKP